MRAYFKLALIVLLAFAFQSLIGRFPDQIEDAMFLVRVGIVDEFGNAEARNELVREAGALRDRRYQRALHRLAQRKNPPAACVCHSQGS